MYRWASEAQMELDMPNVPKWIAVCMYDNEDARQTPMTPPDEIAHPAQFYARAAKVCHAAGKRFIPSSGIRQFANQDQSENDAVYHTAPDWDGYSMQTQMAEADLPRFQRAVQNFKSRVLAENPHATLIVGVGDFANGTLQPPSTVEQAIRTLPPGTILWMNF